MSQRRGKGIHSSASSTNRGLEAGLSEASNFLTLPPCPCSSGVRTPVPGPCLQPAFFLNHPRVLGFGPKWVP